MRIALTIHGAPCSSQASATALRFARAAVDLGHEMRRVFFFHDGVLNGNRLALGTPEEPLPLTGWIELAEASGTELAICVAAGARRGIVDAQPLDREQGAAMSLHPAFTLVGLGQFIEAVSDCDRLVTFAA